MSIALLKQQTASATGTPIGIEEGTKTFRVFLTLTLLGSYATGGDPFDLNAIFGLTAGGPGSSNPSGSLPLKVELQSIKATAQTALFLYNYVPGTTLANGTIQVYTGAAAQSGLAELNAGAYPAGVLADLIHCEVLFSKL